MSKIANLKEEDGKMTFTISNIDVSYINAIRRTILSDIPIVVFKTTPYEENNAVITVNTSRLNNEIVKQRLSCIPIHIDYLDTSKDSIENYLLELDVENKTDTTMIVTTKDFKILNTVSNKYLDEGQVKKIFPPFIPPNGNGEYYIDFLRLRPKISDEIPGERIKLTCKFTVGTARDDSMFNITGTCAYGCTPDLEKKESKLQQMKQKWKDEGKKESEIEFEAKNWKLLEGKRIFKKDSFDFTIQSIGVHTNAELLIQATGILIDKLNNLDTLLEEDKLEIKVSDNTMQNCYDIILENEDYTIGKVIEYCMLSLYYEYSNSLTFCGFKMLHPHDLFSIIRVAYREPVEISSIKGNIKSSINYANEAFSKIKKEFLKLAPR